MIKKMNGLNKNCVTRNKTLGFINYETFLAYEDVKCVLKILTKKYVSMNEVHN